MFRNEVGLQVLEEGDVVRIGNGQVLYEVKGNVSDSITVVTSMNTGKSTSQRRERLTLVKDVKERFGGDTESAQDHPETPAQEEEIVQEHIPGETPAQYKERTGKKLDGRTTSYGRVILAALQRKPMFLGRAKSFNTKAKRVNRWTTAQ